MKIKITTSTQEIYLENTKYNTLIEWFNANINQKDGWCWMPEKDSKVIINIKHIISITRED